MNNIYVRLAKTNIQNNRQLYLPYIISGIVTVMMFYLMMFINNNPGLKSIPGSANLKTIMVLGVGIITIFAYIFIFYTNSFIIKRRKKEIGVYNILGMAVFTMIMGNAFAAITVMTVGIGAPFVLKYGADPVVIGSLALTCGYCGTLCTPMAANFNIVPVAILEMKDKNGVIKKQVLVAVVMLVVQIVMMIMMS